MERIENTQGFLYGYGVFETMKVENLKVLNIEKHFLRLKNSAKELNIFFNMSLGEFLEIIKKEIKKYDERVYVLRFSLGKNGDSFFYSILKREFSYTKSTYKNGYKLTISPLKKDPKSKIIYHKTLNYLENILELERIKELGFNESLFFNIYNEITECITSNIYLVKDNKIYTPLVTCGLLEGTMRKVIFEKCREYNLPIFQKKLFLKDILECDEIFLTNSLMGILKVSSFNEREFQSYFIDELKIKFNL